MNYEEAATGSCEAVSPWGVPALLTFVRLEVSLETGVDNETGVGVTCGGTPRGAEVGIPPAGGLTKVCVDMGKLGRGIVVGKEMFVGIGKFGKFGNVVPVVSEKYKKKINDRNPKKKFI